MLRWTNIKSAYNHPVIKISYVVLLGFPIVIEVLELHNKKIKFASSFYEIFYSSVVLLLMFIFYRLGAPSEIKDNKDIEAFVARRKKTLDDYLADKKKEIVLTNLDDSQKQSRDKIIELMREIDSSIAETIKSSKRNALNTLVTDLFPGCLTRYLENQWISANKKTTFSLIVCHVLYAVAIVLIIGVCYQRVMTVIQTQI